MKMKLRDILHPFLRTAGLAEQAAAHAHRIVERWDVPHEVMVDGKMVPVAKDIDDRKPRMWGLADGRRITSQITLDELKEGGMSPATPLVLALVPAGAALFLLLSAISGSIAWIGLVVAAVGVVFTYRTAGLGITLALIVLSALPLVGVGISPLPWLSHLSSIVHH